MMAQQLKRARKRARITQEHLAATAGTHQSEIACWERGQRPITPQHAVRLRAALAQIEKWRVVLTAAIEAADPAADVARYIRKVEQQLTENRSLHYAFRLSPDQLPQFFADHGLIGAVATRESRVLQ